MNQRGKYEFHADKITTTIGGLAIEIRGSLVRMTVTNPDNASETKTIERVVRTYSPVYDNLEGFLRRAGDEARVGLVLYEQAGPVLIFYDGGPRTPVSDEELRRLGFDPSDPETDVDDDGGGFGFIINVQHPEFDEPGFAPFPLNFETEAQYQERTTANHKLIMEFLGEGALVINLNPDERVLGVQYDDANG